MIDQKRLKKLGAYCSALALVTGFALTVPAQTAQADYSATYYGYDTDNDGYLEETEYVDYSYDLIDYDNDGYISDTEWNDYTSVWYEPYDDLNYDTAYDFDYYDTDNDGYLEYSEYSEAYDSELYNAWDADSDGYVEYSEYSDLYDVYDDYDYDGLYDW
jgi:Ca2+-binding EF-hand superfamily protein